jgi:hypothetical protein
LFYSSAVPSRAAIPDQESPLDPDAVNVGSGVCRVRDSHLGLVESDPGTFGSTNQAAPAGEQAEDEVTPEAPARLRRRQAPDPQHLIFSRVLFRNASVAELDRVEVVEAEAGWGPGAKLGLFLESLPQGGMEGRVLIGGLKDEPPAELLGGKARLDKESHAIPYPEAVEPPDLVFLAIGGCLSGERRWTPAGGDGDAKYQTVDNTDLGRLRG